MLFISVFSDKGQNSRIETVPARCMIVSDSTFFWKGTACHLKSEKRERKTLSASMAEQIMRCSFREDYEILLDPPMFNFQISTVEISHTLNTMWHFFYITNNRKRHLLCREVGRKPRLSFVGGINGEVLGATLPMDALSWIQTPSSVGVR